MKVSGISIMMILSLSCVAYGQNYYQVEKIMYVTAESGLRRRESPSAGARITGVFSFGERVKILQRGAEPETIDGMTDYWYRASDNNFGHCWVFGGYLSEEFPPDAPVLFGNWVVLREGRDGFSYGYVFNPDYSFSNGPLDTEGGGSGTWEQTGGMVVLKYGDSDDDGTTGAVFTKTVRLQVVDGNNIILHFEAYQVRLLRSNHTWW